MAAKDYIREEKNGWILDINPSEHLIEENLMTSASFMLAILDAFNSIFKLGLKKKLKSIEARIKNMR